MTETQPIPDDLPPDDLTETPRPVTDKVRKRANREPKVRFAWVVALLIGLSWIYTTFTGVKTWWDLARIVNDGPIVEAIGFAAGAKITGRPLPHTDEVEVQYTYEGKQYTEKGTLVRTDEAYIAGEPFKIRVDPWNPSRWSNRKEPVGLRENMVASILLGIFCLLCVGAALLLRHLYLRTWRNGELMQARVLEHRQSALAPRSVGLYCALRTGREESPVTVFVPQDGQVAEVGQSIPVIANASRSTALALSNYHA